MTLNDNELLTDNLPKCKIIKYNKSQTTFNNNINNKVKQDRKMTTTLSSAQLKDIKNDIFTIYNIIKDKKLKNMQNNKKSKSKNKKYGNFKTNKCNENKYELYNREDLAYKIYHDYQKINFNSENLNFLERMELYGIKRNLKNIKIKEYLNLKSPKMPEKKRKKIFDSLINDCLIRKNKFEKRLKIDKNEKNEKKLSQKKINEIISRLYSAKKNNNKKNDKTKDININIKTISNNERTKDINNKKQKKISKCHSQKNMNKINELIKRLYYKEINKKDILYKLYLQKVDELLINNNGNNTKTNYNFSNNNNNNKNINSLNDYLKNVNKTKYIFKDDNSLINGNTESINNNTNNLQNNYFTTFAPNSNKEEDNNNNIKIIINDNGNENGIKLNNNEFYFLSNQNRNNNNNNSNNLKMSILIDNFFCNK